MVVCIFLLTFSLEKCIIRSDDKQKEEVGMRLFTFKNGRVYRYFTRKGNKVELTESRYIAVPNWFPPSLKFPHHMKRISKGTLVFAYDENQWYLIPDGQNFRDFSALVIAKSVRNIKYPDVDILYSSLGDEKVFLLKFGVGGNVVLDNFYLYWDGKDLKVMDANEIEWLK